MNWGGGGLNHPFSIEVLVVDNTILQIYNFNCIFENKKADCSNSPQCAFFVDKMIESSSSGLGQFFRQILAKCPGFLIGKMRTYYGLYGSCVVGI